MESLNLLPGEVILIEAVPVKRPATFAHIVLFVVGIMALITSVIVFVSVPEDSYLVGAILLGLAFLLLIGGFAAIPKNPVRPVEAYISNFRVFGIANIKTNGIFNPNLSKCFTVPLDSICDVQSRYAKNTVFAHHGEGRVWFTNNAGTVFDFGALSNAGEVYDQISSLIVGANRYE